MRDTVLCGSVTDLEGGAGAVVLPGVIVTFLYSIYIVAALSGGVAHGSTASYTGLVLVAALVALGVAAPRAGALAALACLPISGANIALPHTFTAAPADYLVMGVGARVVIDALLRRSGGRGTARPPASPLAWGLPFGVLVACAFPFLAALSGAGGAVPVLPVKIQVAEILGLLTASLYPLALVGSLEVRRDLPAILAALTAASALTVATGLGGAWQTLSCDGSLGVARPFSSPFLRPSGLAADPNLFGLIAVILPGAALALSLRPDAPPGLARAAQVLMPVAAALAVLSASRSAILALGVLLAFWLVAAARSRKTVLLLAASAAPLLALGWIWAHTPCPGAASPELPRFSERNDEAAYLKRVMGAEVASQAETLTPTDDRLKRRFASTEALNNSGKPRSAPDEMFPPAAVALDGIESLPGLDQARRLLWREAVLLWADSPWLGVGPANMAAATFNGWRAHSVPLTTLAEHGVLGAGLMAALAVALAVRLARRYQPLLSMRASVLLMIGCLLAAVAASAAQDILRQGAPWAILGLLLLLTRRTPRTRQRDEAEREAGASAT